MSKVSPYKNKASIRQVNDGVVVIIPSRKNLFLIVFLFAWLGGWFFGGKSAFSQVLSANSDQRLFLIFWLIMWSVGGVFGLFGWLWNVAGKEILHINKESIIYIRSLLNLEYKQEYAAEYIKDISVKHTASGIFDKRGTLEAWGLAGGPIAFDYGSKTIRVGAGIDEAEAKEIVEQIKVYIQK